MGLFSTWKAKRELRRKLADCNFEAAASMLAEKLGGAVIKKELADLLDRFCANPCFDTAWGLIAGSPEMSQNFIALFDHCRGATTLKVPRRYSLQQEPEFEPMCEAIAEDPDENKRLRSILVAKGYSDEEIDSAFSEYWRSLMSEEDLRFD